MSRLSAETLHELLHTTGAGTPHIINTVPRIRSQAVSEGYVIESAAVQWDTDVDTTTRIIDTATRDGHALLRLRVADDGRVQLVVHPDDERGPLLPLTVVGYGPESAHALRITRYGGLTVLPPRYPAEPGTVWISTHEAVHQATASVRNRERLAARTAETTAHQRAAVRAAVRATAHTYGDAMDILASLVLRAGLGRNCFTWSAAVNDPEHGSPVMAAIELRGDEILRMAHALRVGGFLMIGGVQVHPNARDLWMPDLTETTDPS